MPLAGFSFKKPAMSACKAHSIHMGRVTLAAEHSVSSQGFWPRVDYASFGIIYGSVTVLSLIMALGNHPEKPLKSAAILFGSVVAISLAKAFAEVMSHAIETGERITRRSFAEVWDHARTTLIAANLPALLFVISAIGLLTVERAVSLTQVYCTALLMLVGGRVGWRIDGSVLSAVLGALFAGGVGLTLAVLKYLIH